MLEKLITDLKKSLPEALRKKIGGSTEEDEETTEASDENGDDESALNAEDGGQEEDKKKKKMSMIIRVVVILGLGYFALDEFVLKKTEPTVEEMVASAAKKRKRPGQGKPAEAKTAEAETKTQEAPPAVTEKPAEDSTATDTTPPIENVNVMDKNEPQVTTTPPVEETPPAVEEKPVVTTPEPKIDQSIDQLVESVDQSSANSMEVVTVPSQGQGGNKDSSMASKIVEEATETAPPAYDQLGRGLVYNCKDKYWACIDKPAYVVCNKNMKWNKSKGKGAECVVQAVYNSEEDCAKIQKYNVNTNKETSFCQN